MTPYTLTVTTTWLLIAFLLALGVRNEIRANGKYGRKRR